MVSLIEVGIVLKNIIMKKTTMAILVVNFADGDLGRFGRILILCYLQLL
jgi:hypothetical protein